MKLFTILIPAFSLLLSLSAIASTLDDEINHLLHVTESSDIAFLRNGKKHTAKAAAKHMRRKFDHFKNDILSCEDFIEKAGTKSLRTGTAYQVITEDGKTLATATWLRTQLATYRSSHD